MARQERLKQEKKLAAKQKRDNLIISIMVAIMMGCIIVISVAVGIILVKFFEMHMLVAVWIGLAIAFVLTFIACRIIKRPIAR